MKGPAGTGQNLNTGQSRPGPISQFFITLLIRHLIPAVFGLLRRIAPVFRFPFTNTVIVTSFDHVQEVFQRHNDFPVPYQRQVDHLSWDPTFLLAMKDTPDYWKTVEQVKALWRTEDLDFVRQIARDVSEKKLRQAGGHIDAIQDLMVPVTEAVIDRYYGVPIPEALKQQFFDSCMHVAGFLFGAQTTAPKAVKSAQQAISLVWQVIDEAIAQSRKNPLPENTIIGRCHAHEVTDDKHLRSYLMGMIMGYLPTNTLANGHALDVILNNPEASRVGRDAAQKDDRKLVLKVVHEALRIGYILPGLWREAPEPQRLGVGTGKEYKIDKGRLLYISGMSAMLDKRRISEPKKFDPERSPDVYMIYGYQFHYCIGAAIADVMMEEIFTALLRESPKPLSSMRYNGNFPWNFELVYGD